MSQFLSAQPIIFNSRDKNLHNFKQLSGNLLFYRNVKNTFRPQVVVVAC